MIGNDLRLRYQHFVVYILHNHAFARGVRNGQMMRNADGGMHIVLLQQRDGFVHRCRPVQQQADGCGGGQAGPAGLLMVLLVVPSRQIGHHQALIIHAVQRHINGRDALYPLHHGAVRVVIRPKAQKIQAAGGYRRIAIYGLCMHDHGAALRPIVIAAKIVIAIYILGENGGAAKAAGLRAAFVFIKAMR